MPTLEEKSLPAEKPPVIVPPSVAEAMEVSADELTAPLASAMPAPTTATPESSPPPASEVRDTRGKVFDPSIHAVKEDGTPAKNKHGRFYPKETGKHGSPANKKVSVPQIPRRPDPTFANISGGANPPPVGSPATPLEVMAPGEDEYTALAEVYLQMGYGPLMALFTAEIRPIPEEHIVLRQSLAAWMRSRKAKEFSPGVAFALCAGGIFMAKLEKPTVREKAALVWFRTKQLWAKWTGKKEDGK